MNFRNVMVGILIFQVGCLAKSTAINEQKEVWTDVGVYTTWKQLNLSLYTGNYFMADGGWYLINGVVQVTRPLSGPFSMGLGFKEEHYQWNGNWYQEHRPMANLLMTKQWGKLALRNRN